MTQLIVTDNKQRIDLLAKLTNTFFGLLQSFLSFVGKWSGNDPHGKNTQVLTDLGNDGSAPCSGTTTHPGGNERHLCIDLEDLSDLFE